MALPTSWAVAISTTDQAQLGIHVHHGAVGREREGDVGPHPAR